ncbi:MAG TPA: hypothetical protein PLG09_02400 [Syntrophomonadaceae bacterium]|nr:hypothetical protein [Syntrophomonadaceae bacterium]HOQ08958.1 hypothetical protein [Syntrophomonadaceae bacterium]HPU47881.1 hypothetical protein [Syntrophomonadaceae bacterium]
MFYPFLNKENPNYLDSSVLLNAFPREVLFYYYHNAVRITDEAYLTLQQVALDDSVLSDMARIWLNLIENQLEAEADLQSFVNNPYLKAIGPYYYPETNTRFYFCKEVPEPQNVMTAFDLELLKQLDSPTAINRELQQYAKTRKNKKNSTADLIREMDMCILALREIERINRHTNYLRKLLEQRYAIVEQENLLPCEPDGVPEKPIKESEERRLDNIIPFSRVRGLRKKQEQEGSRYNHDVKVYFIRYREYEKACDRYKQVLENWPMYQQAFYDRCFNDIEEAEFKMNQALQALELYNTILDKSSVHADYQDVKILETFRYFLETGRASDLQECMNLYEEEKHWQEIKASQERIENTIYFLQNSSDQGLIASEQLDLLLRGQKD